MILEKLHSRITRYLIKKYWKKPSIDFGSAFGNLQKDFNYDLAVDGFLDNASKYVPFKKINLDYFPYDLPDNFYEFATCFGTIHYLKYPDRFLDEMYRVTTKDSVLIISVTLNTLLSNSWSFVLGIDSFHKGLNVESFEKILNQKKEWHLIERTQNINKSKHYFVLKKA